MPHQNNGGYDRSKSGERKQAQQVDNMLRGYIEGMSQNYQRTGSYRKLAESALSSKAPTLADHTRRIKRNQRVRQQPIAQGPTAGGGY